MKKLLVVLLTVVAPLCTFATHITGGELMYEYMGPGSNGMDRYLIKLRLFRDCYSNGPLLENEQVRVGIYSNNQLYMTLALPLSGGINSISLNTAAIPCLTGSPRVCYQVAYYTSSIDLPRNQNGYTLIQTSCCRIGGIINISNSTGAGATYVTKIPGTAHIGNNINNSPEFQLKDTSLVCAFKKFKLPFTAIDMEGDSLSYSFCDAYGNSNTNSQPLPSTLALTTLQYTGSFNGAQPLGNTVTIDPVSGIITGTAPGAGRYVVAVCATEWRNSKIINEHRKDFILAVQVCDFVSADLPTPRMVCDSFAVMFENQSTSSIITSYSWNFGDPTTTNDVSTSPVPVYTYPDTGIYKVKLVVKGANGCIDSAESVVNVFPGFDVDFDAIGGCVKSAVQFTDLSSARYGTLNRWHWDFGDPALKNDTSAIKNPKWQYANTGTYPVKLVASSSKGCKDSTTRNMVMTNKPYLKVSFKDTIVCGYDTLQLFAQGTGSFSWSPASFILNGNTQAPTVFPPASTNYIVTLNENGCIGNDTVRIRKISSITVNAGNDSLICTSDSILLKASSLANIYAWSPASMVSDPNSATGYTRAIPTNTSFFVNATLGKCYASDSLRIMVAPYPKSNAGPDVSICPATKTQLNGSIVGDQFTWSPLYAMLGSNTLQPWVAPTNTMAYVLTASNNTGCLKPVRDTVLVTVLPGATAFAGNDTSFVQNQTLQLQASGGRTYQWFPATYVSDPRISNPVVKMPAGIDTVMLKLVVTDESGCVDDDDIRVTRFKTGATVFVPTGFTPNADGRNDVLRPILAGIKNLHYFRVYNRWGQLVFETREPGKGWDGTIAGKQQGPGTYVYVLEAIDFTSNFIEQKGTVVLLR